ncbi:gamma-glutamyl-gamma-aminobutyrate hydrolase family protein [Marinibaculum pumilum]|uniref:Gamma-glutamyl-gamma-aminobutyrate hydrolase family protein n=1 Tax=Marinibaculum pumilum TaxID=1766165 RepID=A0ABV7L466_9PROT
MSGRRPRIGVTGGRNRGWLLWLFTWLSLLLAGGRAVRLTPGRPIPARPVDGLVIGGGDDIGVEMYGGLPRPAVAAADPARDILERDLIRTAVAQGIPVLGVCRGAQMLNVASGGSLHTDIYEVYGKVPRLKTVLPLKWVEIVPGSRLAGILRRRRSRVNALHHQSIAGLGKGLRVVARDRWGIVQAVEGSDGFAVGVQWHPEFLIFDRSQRALFRALVRAARQPDHGAGTAQPRRCANGDLFYT